MDLHKRGQPGRCRMPEIMKPEILEPCRSDTFGKGRGHIVGSPVPKPPIDLENGLGDHFLQGIMGLFGEEDRAGISILCFLE